MQNKSHVASQTKVDDDTYVVMENLRYFLSDQDTHEPVWFGHLFKKFVRQGYNR